MDIDDLSPEIYCDNQVREAISELFSYQDFLDGMNDFLPTYLNKLILEEKQYVQTVVDFQKKIGVPFFSFIHPTP